MKKTQKRLGNKGFSLVELIVVIAIMAVLIAVIAPTLISKIEESREGTDLQALGEVRSAVVDAMAKEDVYKALVSTTGTTTITITPSTMAISGISDNVTKVQDEIKSVVEKVEWQSNVCDGKNIIVKISKTGQVYAYIPGDNDNTPLVSGDTTFEAGNAITEPTS